MLTVHANMQQDEQVEEQHHEEEEEEMTWKQLGIETWLENHLAKLNMKHPTIIQQNCIPPTLQLKNVIGMAQTGTGKTAAFALPIIQHLAKDIFGIFALIITPTRELAQQIKSHFEILSGDLPLRVALVTGGQCMFFITKQ